MRGKDMKENKNRSRRGKNKNIERNKVKMKET